MHQNINDIAIKLNREFIDALNRNDLEKLQTKFSVNNLLYNEIFEILNSYFGNSIPELFIGEKNIEIFKYDDSHNFGCEISIFTMDNKHTDLTLHTELELTFDNEIQLRFRLIEVM